MIGKTISHYKILEKLGEGGMGMVYKAQDTKLNRTVALKFLPSSLSSDKDARTRFIKEAQTASALDHPNICSIYEIGETVEGKSFIAMACYEGETLENKIKDQRLKINDIITITIQIAKGLARAHEEGIIHRDIKPANIMITKRGEVKILDFGLAKLAGQTRLTRNGTTLGTVAYMSPEQARGEEADQRSDIWSLGVVLYEMLAGELAFKGEFEQAMIYSIINEEPAELTDLVTDLPPELVQIVKKSLSKDLDQRYQTIEEMLEDFKPLSSEAATFIQEPFSKTISRLWRRKKTRRWAISLAAVFLLVITLFLLRTVIFKDVLQAKPVPIAIISFENLTGDNAYDYLQKAIPNLLITSLEQLGGLQVATWERLHDLSKQAGEENIEVIDWELGFELCRMDGIYSIVLGSFTRAGNIFATDVKVLDVRNKRLLKSASAQGEGIASILKRQIDELTWQIAQGVGLDEADILSEQKSVAVATTSSMEAYNYFIRGKEEYNKVNDVDAVRFLERAVQLDSTFGIAYLYLGNAYHRGPFNDADAIKMLKKAKQYSTRVTQKEKLFIDAMYAVGIERNPDKYFQTLKKITMLYPAEKDAHHDLGNYYYGRQQYQKAVVEFNKALKLDPNYGRTLNILGYTYIKLKDYQQAITCFEKYAAAYPGEPNPFDSLAELYFFLGRLDEALAKSKEALTVKPNFASWIKAAYINALREEYDETMKWIDYHIDNSKLPVEISYGYRWKAYFHYWLGNFQASIADIAKSKPVAQETDREQMNLGYSDHTLGWIYYDRKEFDLSQDHYRKWYEAQSAYARKRQHPSLDVAYNFFLGLLDLSEGRLDSAKSRVPKIAASSPEVISFQRDRADFLHNLLQAEIDLAEGAVENVIKIASNLSLPEKPVHMYPETLLLSSLPRRDVLARAYHMNGNLDKAIAEYERLLAPDPSGPEIFLIHPRYHYWLAKLYEKSGQAENAILRYKKFLDIWKYADDDLPELIEAKERLSVLTNTK